MLDDFLLELLKKPVDERIKYINTFTSVMRDSELHKLTTRIDSITDDANTATYTKVDTLKRIDRFVQSAKTHSRIKDEFYTPPLDPFQLVLVNFAGVGSEWDDCHYAIVWDTKRKRDHVTIIPTTSFKAESTIESGTQFNIGQVGFYQEETVALMNQMTTISRKRILKYRHYNPNTKNPPAIVRLSKPQQERIKDGFRIFGLREQTLYESHILDNYRDRLPEFEYPEIQYHHLNLPYIVISSDMDCLIYKVYGDEREYKLFRKPYQIDVDRNKLLKKWFEAKAQIHPDTKEVIKSRDDVRRDSYADIQAAILTFVSTEPSSVTSN